MIVHFLDLPSDVLAVIASNPLLKSKDHANLARTCTDMRRAVRYAFICYAPSTSLRGYDRAARLAAALRTASAAEFEVSGIELDATVVALEAGGNTCMSFVETDVEIVLAVDARLLARVTRISFCQVWGTRSGSISLLNVFKRLPKCSIVVRELLCSAPEVLVAAAESDGRLAVRKLAPGGSAVNIMNTLASVRAARPMRVETLVVDINSFSVGLAPQTTDAFLDDLEALRTCGLSADELVVNEQMDTSNCLGFPSAYMIGMALGRLAKHALFITGKSDLGAIASALAAPRSITYVEIAATAMSDVGEMLGGALVSCGGRPLDKVRMPRGMAGGALIMRALAENRVLSVDFF